MAPTPGMIVARVGDAYVECVVERFGKDLILRGEAPIEWADVSEWIEMPPDAYQLHGVFVTHTRN